MHKHEIKYDMETQIKQARKIAEGATSELQKDLWTQLSK